MNELRAARDRLTRVTMQSLKIEVELGLTFAEIALQTTDPYRQKRMCDKARNSHDNVSQLFYRIPLTQEDARSIANNLDRLRSSLITLGEFF
jgi:hypothetical protein